MFWILVSWIWESFCLLSDSSLFSHHFQQKFSHHLYFAFLLFPHSFLTSLSKNSLDLYFAFLLIPHFFISSSKNSLTLLSDSPLFLHHLQQNIHSLTLPSLPGHPKQPTLPLVRIRVVYTEEEQMFNACRFGYRFEGLVANTEDVVIFAREKAERGTKTEGLASALPDNLINVDDVSFFHC